MTYPRKRDGPLGGGPKAKRTTDENSNPIASAAATQAAADDEGTFYVYVRGPKRDKFWRGYTSRALAQTAAGRLRVLGMDARVERIGDPDAA